MRASCLVAVLVATACGHSPTAPTQSPPVQTPPQSSTPPTTSSPRLSATKFLAFGDSLTAGEITVPINEGAAADTPRNFRLIVVPSASYPTQLATILRSRYTSQAGAIDVNNSGLPAEWAQDGALRLPGVLDAVHPDVVLLLEGYNDLAAEGSRGADYAAEAIDTMAKQCRYRGARVVIATLPPPRAGGPKSVSTQLVLSYNTYVRAIAIGEAAVFVDLYTGMLPDVNRYMGVDGLHPTEAGYQKMAELFFDAIRRDLEVR